MSVEYELLLGVGYERVVKDFANEKPRRKLTNLNCFFMTVILIVVI